MPWPSFGPSLVRSSCVFAARHFPRWPSTAACGGCSGAPDVEQRTGGSCGRGTEVGVVEAWIGDAWWWCLPGWWWLWLMVNWWWWWWLMVDGWWLVNKGSWLKILGCVGTMCWDFLEFTWMVGECLRHVFLWGLVVDNGIERCVFFNW